MQSKRRAGSRMKDAWIIGSGASASAAGHEFITRGYMAHMFSPDLGADDGAKWGLVNIHGYRIGMDETIDMLREQPRPWRPEFIVIAEALDDFIDFGNGVIDTTDDLEEHRDFIQDKLEDLGPTVAFVGPQATLIPMDRLTAIRHSKVAVGYLLAGIDV